MPKLTLDLEHIRVETFSTGSSEPVERARPTTTANTQEPGCTSPTMCNPLQC